MKKSVLRLLCRLQEQPIYSNKYFINFYGQSHCSRRVGVSNNYSSLSQHCTSCGTGYAKRLSRKLTTMTEILTSSDGVRQLLTPIKSPNDLKEYRLIELSNGLRVLLIADNGISDSVKKGISPDVSEPTTNNGSPTNNVSATSNGTSGTSEQQSAQGQNTETEDTKKNGSDVAEATTSDAEEKSEEGEWEDVESDSDVSDRSRNDTSSDTEDESHDQSDSDRRRKPSATTSKRLSAASLCIGVGSFSDPAEIPGLAHFLEHMIFMGSDKFPKENEFDSYISKHGGSSNAFTDLEHTVFHFDVHTKYLPGSLDRFSSLFASPLLKKGSMNREIKAVDSEFAMNRTADECRIEQLLALIADKSHPMSKFTWGNKESLVTVPKSHGIDIYQELKKFCSKHYHAENMTAVIQSRDSLEFLQQLAVDTFGQIPQRSKSPPSFADLQPAFSMETFNKVYKVVPVQDIDQVVLTWSLPSFVAEYRSKPLTYLGWLFGHESSGSIASYLKKKHWALSVECDDGENDWVGNNNTGSLFSLAITLTTLGLQHLDEVVTTVLQYSKMLQDLGPQSQIYDEIKQIREIEFDWIEQEEPQDYVEELSRSIQIYEAENIIRGGMTLSHYKPQKISECLAGLTVDRVNIVVLSDSYKTDDTVCKLKEKWFGTRYGIEDIPSEWRKKWSDLAVNTELHLPSSNKYIPSDFKLKEPDAPSSEFPVLLTSTESSRFFYKRDEKFKVPKISSRFYLRSNSLNESALSRCMIDIIVKLMERRLDEVAYDAELTGHDVDLELLADSLEISISGYSDTFMKLFETVFNQFADFAVNEKELEVCKEEFNTLYHNRLIDPEKFCKDLRRFSLFNNHWMLSDKANQLEQITTETLLSFFHSVSFFVEGVVQGNVTAKEVKEMENYVLSKITGCAETTLKLYTVSELGTEPTYICAENMNTSDENSVVINYYQFGPGKLRQEVLLSLQLSHMDEPCFDYLRTKKQLGYVVRCEDLTMKDVLGYTITVGHQETKNSIKYVDQQIEKFLEIFSNKVQKITDEKFKSLVSSEISWRQCEYSSLEDEISQNSNELRRRMYLFDRSREEIKILREITLEEFKVFCQETLRLGNRHRKLSIQVRGKAMASDPQDSRKKPSESSQSARAVKRKRSQTSVTVSASSAPKGHGTKNGKAAVETGIVAQGPTSTGLDKEENQATSKKSEIRTAAVGKTTDDDKPKKCMVKVVALDRKYIKDLRHFKSNLHSYPSSDATEALKQIKG